MRCEIPGCSAEASKVVRVRGIFHGIYVDSKINACDLHKKREINTVAYGKHEFVPNPYIDVLSLKRDTGEMAMDWANPYVEKLKKGEVVSFRPTGNSMTPKIKSGELVTVSPDISNIEKGDIVLCKCKGRYFCHMVSAIQGDRYQISNNSGYVNGWVGKNRIFGKVTKVEN